MTDGMIGDAHVTVPDLMERVIAFRTLSYIAPPVSELGGETPNEFKIDLATGKIVPNETLIKQKFDEARKRYGEAKLEETRYKDKPIGYFVSPQYNRIKKGTNRDHWKKEMVAQCGAGKKHKAPDHKCQCGLYCYYDLRGSEFIGHSYNSKEIHCCVSVEGKIEAHGSGMRCEKMRVEAIWALSYVGLSGLCEKLKIPFFPVESYNSDQFLNACKEFGDPLPKNLRPNGKDEIPF